MRISYCMNKKHKKKRKQQFLAYHNFFIDLRFSWTVFIPFQFILTCGESENNKWRKKIHIIFGEKFIMQPIIYDV